MTILQKATKVTLEGAGALTLRQTDYVTQGGEGAIYRRDGHIIKLYHDPRKMVADDMPAKIRLLARTLTHSSIVAPKGLVLDASTNPIGYFMPYVEGEAFPRLFTNEYRAQIGLDTAGVTMLTARMHEVVRYTHDQKVLMVDGNELNWLADLSDVHHPVPYSIDVDSWQIDRFKASVIMPSIRDWHSSISVASDWFAWGVVTFLLFTGIHPYKGKLDGYKPGELERRMRDNASVFTPGVRLNAAVRDFECIPGPLRDWYHATFALGERSIPPSPRETGRAQTTFGNVLRMVTTGTDTLILEKLLECVGEQIISVWPCGVVRTSRGNLIEVARNRLIGTVTGTRVAVVARDDGWLIAELCGSEWRFRFVHRSGGETKLSVPLNIETMVRSGERLFAVTETELVELVLQQFSTPVMTIGKRWQILPRATTWFHGVGVSNVLGAMHLIVPYGNDAVAMVRTPELDAHTPVYAQSGNRCAVVVTLDARGAYRAHEFAFDADWKRYTVQTKLVDGPEYNAVMLPKGVTAAIMDDGELTITVPTRGEVRMVRHKEVTTTMELHHVGDKVVYLRDGVLSTMRMS